MLEFIVLGQVPGIHFQVTFFWFSIVSLLLLSYAWKKTHKRHSLSQEKQIQRHFDFISLSSLDQA